MTRLYQKCPDCNGSRRLARSITVDGGGFFSAGVKCPSCEDGYVPFGATAEGVRDMTKLIDHIHTITDRERRGH
jgi:hypothetical protein